MKRRQPKTSNSIPAEALPPPEAHLPPLQRGLGVSAAAMVAAFVLVLGVRTLTTEDLGYHLAYGEHFLSTGVVVHRLPCREVRVVSAAE
jgi:hypothetical protein